MPFTFSWFIVLLIGFFSIAESRLTASGHPHLGGVTASEYSQLLRGEFPWAWDLLRQQFRVEFIHIPKTGGTTIESIGLAYGLNWGMYRFGNYSGYDAVAGHNDVWLSAHHVPPAEASWPIRKLYSSAERIFCITRNPYDRLTSEYKYRLENRKRQDLFVGDDCTADSLNFFVQKVLRNFMSGDRYFLDAHLIPQSKYIWEGEKKWCTDVLRLDGLPWNFNKLMKSLDVNAHIDGEHENPSTCQLTSAALSNKSKSLIQSVYQDDFVRLGYWQ